MWKCKGNTEKIAITQKHTFLLHCSKVIWQREKIAVIISLSMQN